MPTNRMSSVDCYDISTQTWSNVAPMSILRTFHAFASLDKKIYVAGGRIADQNGASVECYDPSTNIWTNVAPMGTIRSEFGLA